MEFLTEIIDEIGTNFSYKKYMMKCYPNQLTIFCCPAGIKPMLHFETSPKGSAKKCLVDEAQGFAVSFKSVMTCEEYDNIAPPASVYGLELSIISMVACSMSRLVQWQVSPSDV